MNKPEDKTLILLVDDNPTNLDILIEILQEDYRLGVVKSGEKALEFVSRTRPDLILLDIFMPGMNGFDVCRALKSSDATRSIPVIFISATDTPEDIARGAEVGGVDFLPKPFLAEEIKERIEKHLTAKG